MTDARVEAAARALFASVFADTSFEGFFDDDKEHWRGKARVAIVAADAADAAAGVVRVPSTPTKAMRQAFHEAHREFCDDYHEGQDGDEADWQERHDKANETGSPDHEWFAMIAARPGAGS